jgi:hypothetical protein
MLIIPFFFFFSFSLFFSYYLTLPYSFARGSPSQPHASGLSASFPAKSGPSSPAQPQGPRYDAALPPPQLRIGLSPHRHGRMAHAAAHRRPSSSSPVARRGPPRRCFRPPPPSNRSAHAPEAPVRLHAMPPGATLHLLLRWRIYPPPPPCRSARAAEAPASRTMSPAPVSMRGRREDHSRNGAHHHQTKPVKAQVWFWELTTPSC